MADESEAEVVRLVRQRRDDGESYRGSCDALEEAGHRPRSGERWLPNTVRRIALRAS